MNLELRPGLWKAATQTQIGNDFQAEERARQFPKAGAISLYLPGTEKKVHEVKASWTRETQVVDEIRRVSRGHGACRVLAFAKNFGSTKKIYRYKPSED